MSQTNNTQASDSAQAEPRPMSVNFSESDHLFLDDLSDVQEILTRESEVTQLLHIIEKLDNKIDSLKAAKKDHAAFYNDRITKAEEQQEFLKARIADFLESYPESSLPTPKGTVYFTSRDSIDYPDEDVLLAYAEEHGLEIKVTKKAYKKPIKKFIEEGGQPPNGWSVTKKKTLSIRS